MRFGGTRSGAPLNADVSRQITSVRYTAKMGKVEKIEREIKDLSPEEMTELREWFAAFDAEAWDRQFEADVRAGKLDALADQALKAHATGQTTKL